MTSRAAGRIRGHRGPGARVAAVLAGAAVLVLLGPAAVVAAVGFGLAWLRGWGPRRLLAAAGWCAPMVLLWLALTARDAGWLAAVTAPVRAWREFWRLAAAGLPLRAAVAVAPAAIPAGLITAALAWAYRSGSVRSGAGGRSPAAAVTFDQRQWRHQARSARARIAAPGAVPLTTRGDLIVAGAVIRTAGHRAGRLAAIGYPRMRSHQIVVGTTGTGKTTLLLRLWTAFMATGLRRQADGRGARPLVVVLDCKGGADARRVADRFRRVLRDAGARSTAVWPDEASLSLWDLPPRRLTTTLVDLVEHGTGSAAYYTDVMEALTALAVEAPCGPPAGPQDLLDRLEPGWLATAYAGTGSVADHAQIRSAGRHLGDVALRYRTLFRRLGPGLDGPGSFADADAWYCILEGTDQIPVAEGQARALTDLLTTFAVRAAEPREILLAVDEFSAVSRRLPIWQLYERARSLGLAVQVSAQSWQGLAATQDERYRIAASAEGGIWLLRTPHPEPLAGLAGTRPALATTRQLGRYPRWLRQGSSGLRDVPVVDPTLIRGLDVGQAAYIYRGGVTYLQVKRLVAAPAAVTGNLLAPAGQAPGQARGQAASQAAGQPGQGREPPGRRPRDPGSPGPGPPDRGLPNKGLPDASPLLDAAFGQEPAP